tara:strand:- start:1551 stop:3821 length:2271 start_codon:yes stop_codon:yes gene_type:complete
MKLISAYKSIIYENFKTQRKRFISQGISSEIVSTYFDKFKFIKNYKELKAEIQGVNVPPERRGDIDAYKDFHELERVVDYVSGQRSVSTNMKNNTLEVSGKPVYKDENFEVYYADSPRACIKYKGSIPYSWCVARSDASNMFYTYRFKPYEPAFYFVKDIKATEKEFKIFNMGKNLFKGKFSNKYHFFVIQVPKNINPENDTQKQYIVTSANNDGDAQMSWEEVVKLNPDINKIKSVLEPKPFTDEEKTQHKRFKNGITDREFSELAYEDKRAYLDIYPTIGKTISYEQLRDLPDDLLNLYVSFGIGLDNEQHTYVSTHKPKAFKRYASITHRKYDEYMNNTSNRYQLRLNFSELSTIKDDDKVKLYLNTLGTQGLNKFISENGVKGFQYVRDIYPEMFKENEKIINLLLDDENFTYKNFLHHLPYGVELHEDHGDMLRLDLTGIVNDFWEDIPIDDEIQMLYDYGWEYGEVDYFDGWEEGLDDYLHGELENFIEENTETMKTIRSVGIKVTPDSLIGLLNQYKYLDKIHEVIREETNDGYRDAYYEVESELENKANNILTVTPYDKTIQINRRALVMFISSNEFFTRDKDDFISNVTSLLEEIYDDYSLPNTYYEVREYIENRAMPTVNDAHISETLDEYLNDAIAEYYEEHGEEEEGEEEGDKLDKLKYTTIELLQYTLKKLGEDPDTTRISNELVTIDIDRTRFKLDGSVFVVMQSEKTKETHGGYIKIKDLPTYYTNYKLFESFFKFKKLLW